MGKRMFVKCFGENSKIEINLSEIPTNILLEEVNERLGNELEVQGLKLLLLRLGINELLVGAVCKDKSKN